MTVGDATSHLITVDVSAAVPFAVEAQSVVAALHEPAGAARAILICWPGGSSGRSYWEFSGYPGYNFAAHMVEHGFAVLAADPLGVGDSSRSPDADTVTLTVMAAAAAEFTRQARELLAPSSDIPVIGVGHSLGGCITVIAQAEHACYDRVVSLGYTHGAKDAVTTSAADQADARAAAGEQAKALFTDWDAGYAIAPREPNHAWLYTQSTPAEVVAADDATVAAWPRQAYVEALISGYTTQFARAVQCPILLAFGDHDIPARPYDDVGFYTSSSDVTLVIAADAAHCHNFASTRTLLWDRIGAWVTTPTISEEKERHV